MYRISALAIAIVASVPAAAQAPAQTPPASAEMNRRADVEKTLDENFGKSDANNDGFLSEAEVRQAAGRVGQQIAARMEQEFKALDRDKNGQLSLQEFQSVAAARVAQMPANALQQLDANKDGKVSPAEFRTPVLTAFDRVDINKDGTVSPEEKQKASSR
jgi:hypothetical protein